MKRFTITIAACILMAVAVPFPDVFAVTATSPAYTHYVYMVGHASWIHYIINTWTLLAVHNLLRWYRVLAAYLWAVLESYVLPPDRPTVGLSVMTCFFIGFAAPWLWKKDRMAVVLTMALLLLTCFLSSFAGVQHIASFVFGVAFCYGEGFVRKIRNEVTER